MRIHASLLVAALTAAGCTVFSFTASADATITLELPYSGDTTASARSRPVQAAPLRTVATRGAISRASYGGRRGTLASRGQSTPERVVGRLAMLSDSTKIFRGRRGAGGLLIQAQPGTYVAIQEQDGDWLGVLMADYSIGWVPKASARMLDYQVVSTGIPRASIPEYSDSSDIYPRSEQPFFSGDANALLQNAYGYLGVPYLWGGNTSHGIDCSGFVKNVFGACGYRLPRLGSDQMASGVPVPSDQLQPGDRLYFGRRHDRVGVTHTGLYIGNGYFIHASSSHHGVSISKLSDSLYARIYVCARR